jgi:Protein of unknown function (DUF4065)
MSNKPYHTNPPDRTEELIIYIASRLQDKPNYGSILLGKSLCLIDSMNYLKRGNPISELEYIKQELGPTPTPAKFLSVRTKLENEGELEKIEVDYFGRKQIRYIAKRQPNVDVFEKDEIVLINDVLESLGDVSAKGISDYTHTFISWIFANHMENLPFYTFLLTNKEPDLSDYEWAKKSIEQLEN